MASSQGIPAGWTFTPLQTAGTATGASPGASGGIPSGRALADQALGKVTRCSFIPIDEGEAAKIGPGERKFFSGMAPYRSMLPVPAQICANTEGDGTAVDSKTGKAYRVQHDSGYLN